MSSNELSNPQFPKPLPGLDPQPKKAVKCFSEEEIKKLCQELGQRISNDYAGKKVLCIGILKGCLPFMADLVREFSFETDLDFVRLSSYKGGTESTGTVHVVKDISQDIQGKEILIIEEIIDTGRTLKFLKERLLASKPNSLNIVALFDKKEKRVVDIEADYVGTEVADHFLIGYGLDIGETCRNLKDVYYLEF